MCSSALANFFIDKANCENIELSNLKLQKLMFIGYGWVYALTREDITDNEGFQAWQYGPVLPSIYHQVKKYGYGQISEKVNEFDFEASSFYYPELKDHTKKNILQQVWDLYKNATGHYLVNLTHEEATPWFNTFYNNQRDIPLDEVYTYYFDYLSNALNGSQS